MLTCTLIGNLGADPEMRYTPSGSAVTQMRVACRTGKDAQGAETTTWVSVSCWGKLSELASQYLNKGSKVAVVGRLRVREFLRQDGTKGTAVEVNADNLEFLSPRPKDAPPVPAGVATGPPSGQIDELPELPF